MSEPFSHLTAFRTIAEMWIKKEYPQLKKSDKSYRMVMLFASYCDLTANAALQVAHKHD